MKILLIAPVHNYGAYSWQNSESPFVEGQGQQSWYRALMSMGHQVEVYRYSDSLIIPELFQQRISNFFSMRFPHLFSRYRRVHDTFAFIDPIWKVKNNRIKELVSKFLPDMIIVSGGSAFFSSRIFSDIKKMYSIPIVYFSGVNPQSAVSSQERLWVTKCADYIFTNDDGYAKSWRALGIKNVDVLPISAFDDRAIKRHVVKGEQIRGKQINYDSDVCFVGSLSKDRITLLERLTKYHLSIWGACAPGIKLSNKLMKYYCGEAHYKDLDPIYRSTKIALNFQPKDMISGGNMRTFEIPGYGAFQLTDKMKKEWYEDRKEVVVFKNDKDLINKIDYFLKHDDERKKIAHAGHARTLKEHTYQKRFKKMFSIVEIKLQYD